MIELNENGSAPIKAWVGNLDQIEDPALKQTKNIARLPFIAKQGMALMPDVHMGKGATVGSVIPTVKAIIPAAVGVDIGCGMNAVRLSLKASDLPDSLAALRSDIERTVPMGKGGEHDYAAHGQAWRQFDAGIDLIIAKHPKIEQTDVRRWIKQLGTLGSGNHFIEICTDENQDVWVMLHSGSRGIGNTIGTYFIEQAKIDMRKHGINLPDMDLSYLNEGTTMFDDYVEAMTWAQNYALENRRLMMEAVLRILRKHVKPFQMTTEAVNCHHNYTQRETHFGEDVWLTRKGAVSAREGQLGIIPGSMGQRSYIVRGKGNEQAYCSCSHGAGRVHSRTAAKKLFTVEDLKAQTEGVECRKDEDILDEIPAAYKDIDVVMANQTDLIEVVHTLKAVLCCKGV